MSAAKLLVFVQWYWNTT